MAEGRGRNVTAATRRAREMMGGGLIGGHVVGLTILGLALGIGGRGPALSAAVGFAAVVIFYSLGQAIEVVASELEPFQGLGLVMVSYAVRVVGIAAGLWGLLGLPSIRPLVSEGWLLLSVTGTVLAWVFGVVFVASRQHVPVYDREYEPPPSS